MERFWLKSYPKGVPADIDPDQLPSLAAFIEDACARHAERTAFISFGNTLSYGELEEKSRAFAAWLQAKGCRPGTRVALMMPNLLQYPVALFGVLRAGCVVVSCNPLYTPRELEYQLQDSGAEVIVVLENFAHTLQQVVSATRVRHVVVTSMGEMLHGIKGHLINFVVRHVRKMVPAWHLPGAVRWRDVLEEGAAHGFAPVAIGGADLAFLQYTGGTTGICKGAMLTHRNICANVLQARVWLSTHMREEGELIVTALPLYHVFALTANCLSFIAFGCQNLLIANPRDIGGFVKELVKHRFTVITGVNTLFNALLNHPKFARIDFSALRFSVGGGMAVQEEVARRWKAVTGCPVLQAYGLSETSPALTIDPLQNTEFRPSVGLPMSSTDMSIRNDAGEELPQGDTGEICVRGPQVMQGYWQRPEETALVMTADGYLRTGDIGFLDAEGYLHLLDRKKDVIVVSGFNVYPNEIEDVLALHPGVMESAAIGVKNEHSGELVKAFVVRRDAELSVDEVIRHCRAHLTGYKVPHQVEFCDALPHTTVGKVLRRMLRDRRPEPAGAERAG